MDFIDFAETSDDEVGDLPQDYFNDSEEMERLDQLSDVPCYLTSGSCFSLDKTCSNHGSSSALEAHSGQSKDEFRDQVVRTAPRKGSQRTSGHATEADSGIVRSTDSDLLTFRTDHTTPDLSFSDSQPYSDEIAKLNREMQSIQIQCDRLFSECAKQERRVRARVAQANEIVSHVDQLTNRNTMKHSAEVIDFKRLDIADNRRKIRTNGSVMRRTDANANCPKSPPEEIPDVDSKYPLTPTFYTHPENLEKTIKLQQKLFLEAHQRAAKRPASITECRETDNARHVSRRRLLQRRAAFVSEERQGATTDDDNVSEFKGGRYWTKEARRQHIARSRERRALAHRTRHGQDNDLLKLSRDKLLLLKRRKQLHDRYVTIQELLAHGSGSVPPGLGVLSVTTV